MIEDGLAWVGNVLNLLYNIPQVYLVLRRQSSSNISAWFLYLRMTASLVWITYAELTEEKYVLASYTVTAVCTSIILAVKLRQKLRQKRENSKGNPSNCDHEGCHEGCHEVFIDNDNPKLCVLPKVTEV